MDSLIVLQPWRQYCDTYLASSLNYWCIIVHHIEHENIYKEKLQSDFKNLHLLSDIQSALNIVKLMISDKIQIANLKDALRDLNIPLKPEEQQMLEETLDADGMYDHCHSIGLNRIVLLRAVIKLNRIPLYVWAFETVSV